MKKNKFEFIIDSEFQSQIPASRDVSKIRRTVKVLLQGNGVAY